MDQALYDYFLQLGFADDDIQFLCAMHPELTLISADRALANIALVVRYGYPEADLDSLLALNPSFLLDTPAALTQKLSQLGDDVEAALKADPDRI